MMILSTGCDDTVYEIMMIRRMAYDDMEYGK